MLEFTEGKWYCLPTSQLDEFYAINSLVTDLIGLELFRVDFAHNGDVYKIYIPDDNVSYDMKSIKTDARQDERIIISAADCKFFIECDEPLCFQMKCPGLT